MWFVYQQSISEACNYSLCAYVHMLKNIQIEMLSVAGGVIIQIIHLFGAAVLQLIGRESPVFICLYLFFVVFGAMNSKKLIKYKESFKLLTLLDKCHCLT